MIRPFVALLVLALSGGWLAQGPPAARALRERAVRALAPLDGELALAGLREPVEVIRDRWGVPHIYARNQEDLFFAQGFVAAQDRLWQLDLWRRAAEGRLSEVLGPGAVDRDTFARLLRYRGDMEREWRSYSDDAKAIAGAFASGVNAQIAYVNAHPDKLPIEFQLTGSRPEPWTPEVVIGRLAGYVMTGSAASEVRRAILAREVGAPRTVAFMPVDPPVAIEVPRGLDLADITPDVLRLAREADATPVFQEPAPVGSNNWVLSGARTASGKPLLANDPHRAIRLPSLRYTVHLNAPGWDVIGAGEPALPGVAAGHNDRVAFGFTIVGIDQQDLYVEELHPTRDDRYKAGGEWVAMEIQRERIAVKGEAAREVTLRFTRHGPVLHVDRDRRRAYALRWVGMEPGTAGYLASLSLNRARNWQQFLAAAARWKVPSENLVYADVDGNIGWIAAGLAPIRSRDSGLLPVPGASGAHEWTGFLPIEELPQAYNPPSGYIATANHNILPPGYSRALGYEWSAPFRFQRVVELIEGGPAKLTVRDSERMQHDETSVPARRLLAWLKEAVGAPGVIAEADAVHVVELLTNWDGTLSADSAAAAVYQLWLPHLTQAAITATTRPEDRKHFGRGGSAQLIIRLLEPIDPATRHRVMTGTSLAAAWADAAERMGIEDKTWAWGRIHESRFEHPLASTPERRELFNLPPRPRGGDGTTPNSTGNGRWQTHGASFREVIDLGDWDRSTMTNVPGQSGQPGSPYYGNLYPLWASGEYHPMLFSRSAIDKHAEHRLALRPSSSSSRR
ncbi:MAG TPA: penicillin acylase family protein [Vicinamibacterales bacterium]|nr:penicillin acylase family protein [Vicinamibacterales bacterium]